MVVCRKVESREDFLRNGIDKGTEESTKACQEFDRSIETTCVYTVMGR